MKKDRGLKNMRLNFFAAALTAVLGLSSTSQASTIQFSPTGNAADTIGVTSFTFAPGNTLSLGSVPIGSAGVGRILPLLYQAVIQGFNGDNGPLPTPAGLNSTYQLTVVLRFNEQLTSGGSIPGAQTFALAADQTGSFLEFYYDNHPATFANALTGKGFNDGQLIAQGTPSAALDNNSNFGFPDLHQERLDQTGPNNYPGVNTLIGSGSAIVGSYLEIQNPNFFVTKIDTLDIDGDLRTAFNKVNPSALFDAVRNSSGLGSSGPAPAQAGVSSVGTVNGLGGGPGGPPYNFIFQTVAEASFTAVPEPGTVGLALFGIGGAAFGMIRSRRRTAA